MRVECPKTSVNKPTGTTNSLFMKRGASGMNAVASMLADGTQWSEALIVTRVAMRQCSNFLDATYRRAPIALAPFIPDVRPPRP